METIPLWAAVLIIELKDGDAEGTGHWWTYEAAEAVERGDAQEAQRIVQEALDGDLHGFIRTPEDRG